MNYERISRGQLAILLQVSDFFSQIGDRRVDSSNTYLYLLDISTGVS